MTLGERFRPIVPTRRDFIVGAVSAALGILCKAGCEVQERLATEERHREIEEMHHVRISLLRRIVDEEINNNPHGRNQPERLQKLQEYWRTADQIERDVSHLHENGFLLSRLNLVKFRLDVAINAIQHPQNER